MELLTLPKLLDKVGHYSGNRRLDTSTLQEPEQDSERVREKWFGGKRKVSVKRRLKMWKNIISETTDPSLIKIHMVGQSHIDCAWMWRYEQTRKKAYVTFRKAILHSKMFPESFCFALSEPILLEWIKEDNPMLFKEIQETVKAGNIELVGGSYVEPDCMMPSGEAFIRQRLYGMRFYRDNFGILPSVEWFLDSFGYNYGLPQILVKSGAKYFWTTKITWNKQTTFPFVNFWWQGPDGTKILSANFNMGTIPLGAWNKYHVGRHLLRKDGRKVWDYTMDYNKLIEHVDDEICPHVGCFFGMGDGGHGPTHREVAYANEQAKDEMFKWSRVETFYKELKNYSDRFPVWNDELYLETHRGCFSNHAEVKRHNRKYENIITSLEILAILTSIANPEFKYPKEELEFLWKTTLKNQFHDVLPGSSIPEVFDDCWEDWKEQDKMIDKIIRKIGLVLSDKKDRTHQSDSVEFYLFNPLSWERKSRIFIPTSVFKEIKLNADGKPNYAEIKVLTGTEKSFICQPIVAESENTIDRMHSGWWTVIDLNPLSLTPVRLTVLKDSKSAEIGEHTHLKASEDSISSDIVSVKIDPSNGAILELKVNGVNGGNNLLSGKSSNLSVGFLDQGDPEVHAWNLTPEYWKYPINFSNNKDVKIRISDIGPIFTTIEITKKLADNPITQKITLFEDLPNVFLEYITDWKQKDVMLKVQYRTATNAKCAVADMAYCTNEYKTIPQVPCDQARYEKICQKYFDLSTPDNNWGLAMINEGKYAFDVNGSDVRLTMLRACKYPNPAPEAWVNQEREINEKSFGHKVPEYSGLGPFKCRYALLPHNGGSLINRYGTPNVVVTRKAEEFNKPVIIVPVEGALSHQTHIIASNAPLFEALTPNVYLGALKAEEWDKIGDFVFRFAESSGIRSKAIIKFSTELSERINKIKPVDLLEREIKTQFKWDKDERMLTFEIGKFEICSFKLVLKNTPLNFRRIFRANHE